jgi:ABC-type multidrug transport system permease subunit
VGETEPDRARPGGADAILATTLLTITIGVGVTAGARPAPLSVLAGTLLTICAEAVAGQAATRVKTWWANQTVRVIAILLSLTALTAGALFAPTVSVSVAVGAIGTYLVLFGLVTAGAVPPPAEWPP